MARLKKEKKEKYYSAEEVERELSKVLDAYPDIFSHLSFNDIKVLFKNGKNKEGKKHVTVRIIKEPMTLVTTKKAILMVTDGWWADVIDSDRTKGLIDGLLSIEVDDFGNLTKRDYDIKTFSELLKEEGIDWGKFVKLLPGEEKLVLSGN